MTWGSIGASVTALLVSAQIGLTQPPVAPPPRAAVAAGPRYDSLAGEVTAVDGESVTVRGFAATLRGVTGSFGDGADYTESGTPLVVELRNPDRTVVCNRVRVTRTVLTFTLPTGETTTLHRHDEKPRRFVAGPVVAGAAPPEPGLSGRTYLLADIRVGDEVSVLARLADSGYAVESLLISRRPGGRVPWAPWDEPDEPRPYSERMNEQQALEEFGTPLPTEEEQRARYRQRYLARKARLAKERAEQAAPMPREAKPKP